VADVQPAERPDKFSVVILGRFDERAARTKQLRLSVASFGKAAMDPVLGEHPLLTIFGLKEPDKELSALADAYAGRHVQVRALDFEVDRAKLFSELAAQSAVMMLSWYEAFGLVAWEAIAASVPLVLSRATGAYKTLQKLFGDETDTLVAAVDVSGAADPKTVVTADLDAVTAALRRIATDTVSATSRARELRRRLIEAGVSWDSAAGTLLTACKEIDAAHPRESAIRNPEDLAFVEYTAEDGTVVALCVVVDRPDEVREQLAVASERAARSRGVPIEVSSAIEREGLSAATTNATVLEALIEFVLGAPLRAYASVIAPDEEPRKDGVRMRPLLGLLKTRFKKRNFPLRRVSAQQALARELAAELMAYWRKRHGGVPTPEFRREPLGKNSLVGIARFLAWSLAAARSADRQIFDRLRIKYAHIFDERSRKNYSIDDAYP
jgi:hypothetical protein